MKRRAIVTVTIQVALLCRAALAEPTIIRADVIIAGGSTAALAAAFAASEAGATTVLLEPTDWIGGQFTTSGVPAVDEAWHQIKDQDGNLTLDVRHIARDPRNMNPALHRMLSKIGNPGKGWVSRFCFEPRAILDEHFVPWERRLADKLTIYRETVVKRVETDRTARQLVAIEAIQRRPRPELPRRGYDALPSSDLADWYDSQPSARFAKSVIRFEGQPSAVFVDATEWGELLVLSGAEYLQGVDVDGTPVPGGDTFGQATVFGFVQRFHESPAVDLARQAAGVDHLGLGKYAGRDDAWPKIWTYRRLHGRNAEPSAGDLSLQNWGYSIQHHHGGNDYPFGYLLLDRVAAQNSIDDWQGGIDLTVMAAAEQRAFAWHHWFKRNAPSGIGAERITIAEEVLGTGHGLSKLPYIRDTRRSRGLDHFVLKIADLVGQPGASTAKVFNDTVAIGAYPADVHPLAGHTYPAEVMEHIDTRPFCIPFRALTCRDYGNLLVAGKTMAQSFMANSATRLHPIEWSSGTAAGVCAAWMQQHDCDSAQALSQIREILPSIARQTPVRWTIDSTLP